MIQTEIQNSESYNGWANRETWNVSLWIGNDENLYDAAAQAVDFLTRHGKLSESLTPSWAKAFATVEFFARYGKPETPDGIQTNDPKIDWSAIANMIKELS